MDGFSKAPLERESSDPGWQETQTWIPRLENRRQGVLELFLGQEAIWKWGESDVLSSEGKRSLLCSVAYPQINSHFRDPCLRSGSWTLPFSRRTMCPRCPHLQQEKPAGRWLFPTDLFTFPNLLGQAASDHLPNAAPPTEWSKRARMNTVNGRCGTVLGRAGSWGRGLQGSLLPAPAPDSPTRCRG